MWVLLEFLLWSHKPVKRQRFAWHGCLYLQLCLKIPFLESENFPTPLFLKMLLVGTELGYLKYLVSLVTGICAIC